MATIKMRIPDLINEHKKLLKILEKGTKTERDKEAKDQAKELKTYLKLLPFGVIKRD